MSYVTLTESTTAFAEDIMQNFLHCSQGDFLPLGGSSLQPTNAGTHLGNGTNYWSSLFCKTLDYNDIALTNTSHKFWTKIASHITTVGAGSEAIVTFDFAKGADCLSNGITIGSELLIKYLINTSWVNTSSAYLTVNGGATNVSICSSIVVCTRMTSGNYTVTVSNIPKNYYISMGFTPANGTSFDMDVQGEILINVKANNPYKTLLLNTNAFAHTSTANGANNCIYGIIQINTITSIELNFYYNAAPGSIFEVWAR